MVRVLQVCAQDVTVQKLLLPLIDQLKAEGYQVTSACSPGRYTPSLVARGYSMRPVNIDRRITPWANARSVWELFRLIRREKFDIVHVHTPVAAALGRLAAWLAGVPIVIYTAHGFFHHENMRPRNRQACVWVERLLGRTTDMLFTQSQEDALSAVQDRIRPSDKVQCIGNGVDVTAIQPGPSRSEAKTSFGIPPTAPVVGFMGPIIAEKGVVELVQGFEQAINAVPDAYLLMAGDVINGDRDLATKEIIRAKVAQGQLASRVVFAGYQEDISGFLQAIDLFALPSHREGMPRSIIEAMASGKPVVATDIRGCREEIVHDVTGMLVPLRDGEALGRAMARILSDPELGRRMGQQGRQRAEELYDEQRVLDRQVTAYWSLVQRVLPERAAAGFLSRRSVPGEGTGYSDF
jgi:glycosyltransferase involved in cell wall biosynthesis